MWILRMGTFYGDSALNSRDEIKSDTRCNYHQTIVIYDIFIMYTILTRGFVNPLGGGNISQPGEVTPNLITRLTRDNTTILFCFQLLLITPLSQGTVQLGTFLSQVPQFTKFNTKTSNFHHCSSVLCNNSLVKGNPKRCDQNKVVNLIKKILAVFEDFR